MTLKNGRFSHCYQQNGAFFNKKALFFTKKLVWVGYSDIFASVIK
jgi:hypothetical protein